MSHQHQHDPVRDPRCRQVFELLSGWLDGEVPAGLAVGISWTATCRAWRE
jgi:hypothetical protein